MADRDHVARADEDVGLAEQQLSLFHAPGAQDDEERVAVDLELRPLVRAPGVFHGEIVQTELLLHLAHEPLVGLVQSEPDEGAGLNHEVADLLHGNVADPFSVAIRDAVHHHVHAVWFPLFRHSQNPTAWPSRRGSEAAR